MKLYYYSENDQQFGPFSFDELKVKRLKKSSLVWSEGMKDWTRANEIEELKDICISEPPSLPIKANNLTNTVQNQIKEEDSKVKVTKFDQTYKKETEAFFLGILLLVVPVALKLSDAITFDTVESYNQATAFFSIGSLALRFVITIYIINIASRQNRDSRIWGWFAFFLPSIALIIIGQLKKLSIN